MTYERVTESSQRDIVAALRRDRSTRGFIAARRVAEVERAGTSESGVRSVISRHTRSRER